ncbi:MAG: hypothetical protein REI09_15410, partial [Candidatus Dactylopiibacterium sp.]|nr:hypothetical protein [Candidatus Dactylopiibacterium sp.]
MRSYPIDSPEAIARLLALAVTVDGVPSEAELDMLEARGALQYLGMSRDAFSDVIDALCSDLREALPGATQIAYSLLRPEVLHALLDEVRAPELQRDLTALFIEIFSADQRYPQAESAFLRTVLAHWGGEELD